MQVLVDADNVPASRLRLVVAVLVQVLGPEAADPPDGDWPSWFRMIVAGRSHPIDRVDWPTCAELIRIAGWQEADMALASAYVVDDQPLLLATGDGDFGLLASRHRGRVLVVSPLASARLREAARVIDPAGDGGAELRDWLAHVTR